MTLPNMQHTKSIISAFLLLSAFCAKAQVGITWDPPAGASNTGYVIYAHTNALSSATLGSATIKAVLPSPTQLTMTLSITNTTRATVRWYVYASATYTVGESPLSNQLIIDLAPAPVVLAPPSNLRVLPP